MSHIFISYSHKDKEYVHKLHDALVNEGFDVWIDDRIDYGDKWLKAIEKNLDECDAFIIVMSKNSSESEMVQNEITRARDLKKQIFPLLLDGNNWLVVQSRQFVDVRDGSLPTEKFYARLENVTSRQKMLKFATTQTPLEPPIPTRPLSSMKTITQNIRPVGRFLGVLFLLGIALWGGALSIPAIGSWMATAMARATQPTATHAVSGTSTPLAVKDAADVPMILVPASEFTMGSNAGFSNEKPAHPISLFDFYIDKYEVTNALYRECVEARRCVRPFITSRYYASTREDHPVVNVNWLMAKVYCEWRNADLPTEAQWEKAARGDDLRPYPWGEVAPIEQYANFNGSDTKRVGSYPFVDSPYGVLDIAGNVAEWVYDWYSTEYYEEVFRNPILNPTGPIDSRYQSGHSLYGRVIRGGSWRSSGNAQITTTYRSHADPDFYADDLGFRCAKYAP